MMNCVRVQVRNNIRVQVRKKQLFITYKCIHIVIQVDFIIALENLRCLRRHGVLKCRELECKEISKRSKLLSLVYSWLKLDYDSQKKEMKRFHSSKNVRIKTSLFAY